MFKGFRSRRDEREWLRLESILEKEDRFLRASEFIILGKFPETRVFHATEEHFRRGRLLKQFTQGDRSIIVDASELPEVGRSQVLNDLLLGAGILAVESSLEESFGLNTPEFLTDKGKLDLSSTEYLHRQRIVE